MIPLTKEELSQAAEQAWYEYNEDDEQHREKWVGTVFKEAYALGYAKCVEQMAEQFNELLNACIYALGCPMPTLSNQMNIKPED